MGLGGGGWVIYTLLISLTTQDKRDFLPCGRVNDLLKENPISIASLNLNSFLKFYKLYYSKTWK